jgi:hypothetical protein
MSDQDRFKNVSKDVIVKIAIILELPDILSLCRASKRFNTFVCENRDFWITRLRNDYGIRYLDMINLDISPDKKGNPKKYYQLLTQIQGKSLNEILEIVIKSNDLVFVRYIVEKNSELLDKTSHVISTALEAAFETGADSEIIKYLLEYSRDNHKIGYHEEINVIAVTAMALGNARHDIVRYMIVNGYIDTFVLNMFLMGSVKFGDMKELKLLIELGATDLKGAYEEAKKHGHTEIMKYISPLL